MLDLGLSVLVALALTVFLIWPSHGPTVPIRKFLKIFFGVFGLEKALDCYFCLSFWTGLLVGGSALYLTGLPVFLLTALLTPLLVWFMQSSDLKFVNYHVRQPVSTARKCGGCGKPKAVEGEVNGKSPEA